MTDFGYFGIKVNNFDTFESYLSELKNRYLRGVTISPEILTFFSSQLANKISASNIFVPWFGCGNLAWELRKGNSNVYCYDIREECVEAIGHFKFNYLDLKTPSTTLFDLIVSDLPYITSREDSIIYEILDYCSKYLKDDALCLFSFSGGITFRKDCLELLSEAEKLGLFANAYIDMPDGAYLPMMGISTKILLFQKKKSDLRYIASLQDVSEINAIIDNFLNHQNAKKLNLGQWVDSNKYRDYRDFASHLEMIRIQKDFGGEIVELEKISTEFKRPDRDNDFTERDNNIFIPKIGTSPVVTSVVDFQIKAQNYIQVVLDGEKALAGYVTSFLNSPKGKEMRSESMTGVAIPQFSLGNIKYLPIVLPTLKDQYEIQATYQKISELEAQLAAVKRKFVVSPIKYKEINRSLKNINNAETTEKWAEELPFPLASILRRYLTESSYEKKQEALLNYFEGFAVFHACILLSVLNSNRDLFNSKEILEGTEEKHFLNASFGSWVIVNKKIATHFRRLIYSKSKDQEEQKRNIEIVHKCFKTNDDELLKILLSEDINNIINKTKDFRNEWKGHPGINTEEISRRHVQELEKCLIDLRKKSEDLYEKIELIRIKGMEYSEGIYESHVELLTGSNSLFTKENYSFSIPLEKKKLYLHMKSDNTLIELLPFIIFKNSPASESNACYFYSRIDKNDTKYVSYHFENKPDDLERGKDAFDVIKSLVD